jgi:hypothetical protein
MTSTYMQYLVIYALGRAHELGFAARPLHVYSGKWLADMVNVSGHPRLIASYRLPVGSRVTATSPGKYFTWNEVVTQALTSSYVNKVDNFFTTGGVPVESYAANTRIAIASMVDNNVPGATQALSWLKPNIYDKIGDNAANPQWNILPRTDTNVLPAVSTYVPPFPGTVTNTTALTFTGNPTTITAGQSATLTWSSTNTTSCTATGGWTGTKGTTGSQVVTPTANATYTLTCTDATGSSARSVTITVGSATTP